MHSLVSDLKDSINQNVFLTASQLLGNRKLIGIEFPAFQFQRIILKTQKRSYNALRHWHDSSLGLSNCLCFRVTFDFPHNWIA